MLLGQASLSQADCLVVLVAPLMVRLLLNQAYSLLSGRKMNIAKEAGEPTAIFWDELMQPWILGGYMAVLVKRGVFKCSLTQTYILSPYPSNTVNLTSYFHSLNDFPITLMHVSHSEILSFSFFIMLECISAKKILSMSCLRCFLFQSYIFQSYFICKMMSTSTFTLFGL